MSENKSADVDAIQSTPLASPIRRVHSRREDRFAYGKKCHEAGWAQKRAFDPKPGLRLAAYRQRNNARCGWVATACQLLASGAIPYNSIICKNFEG